LEFNPPPGIEVIEGMSHHHRRVVKTRRNKTQMNVVKELIILYPLFFGVFDYEFAVGRLVGWLYSTQVGTNYLTIRVLLR
jgi:hypothetical protein